MLDIIWDNIWPWEHEGIFLEVADGEVYRTDITKDETQRKGHNCWKGMEIYFFFLKIVPSLQHLENVLSHLQITHILPSAKTQCSHWSQQTLSKSIPWQNFDFRVCNTAGIPKTVVLWEMTTLLHPFQLLSGGPTSLWGVKCEDSKPAFFCQGAMHYSAHILPKAPRTAATSKIELFHWFSHPDLYTRTSFFPWCYL